MALGVAVYSAVRIDAKLEVWQYKIAMVSNASKATHSDALA